MTLAVGRITIPESMSWVENGAGEVRLSGWLEADTSAEAGWLRWQLLGLSDRRGERFVPVTIGHDPDRSGWFEVLDSSVEHVVGVTDQSGARKHDVRLRRVDAAAAPRWEQYVSGGVFPNAHGVDSTTEAVGWTAIPGASTAIDPGTSSTVNTWTRATETGTVRLLRSVGFPSAVVSAHVPLGNVYDGAATIEVDITGSGDWHPVIGGGMPDVGGDRWRVTNGGIRAYVSDDLGGAPGTGVLVEVWDGAAWVNLGQTTDPNVYRLHDGTVGVTIDDVSATVLANTPSYVMVRTTFSSGTTGRVMLDLGVRRGDRNVLGLLKSTEGETWGLSGTDGGDTPVTAFADDRGVYYGNDVASNQAILSVPKAHTIDTLSFIDDGITLDAATTSMGFGIGVELDGASGYDVAAEVSYQYYAQQFVVERVGLP